MPRVQLESAGVSATLADGGERVILSPTTVSWDERRVAIIGANGSGKTTLARLLNGLNAATTGRVLIDGVDVAKDGARVRRTVGFSFTDPSAQLVMPTCVEDIELSLRRSEKDAGRRRERAMAVLERYGLADHAHDSVHSLSGGQRQLLALAGVLAVAPTMLVADEPTTLLDLANSRKVADLLFGLDLHLVLLTHDLELARRCDRVLVVDDTRVVFDGSADAAIDHYVSLVESRA